MVFDSTKILFFFLSANVFIKKNMHNVRFLTSIPPKQNQCEADLGVKSIVNLATFNFFYLKGVLMLLRFYRLPNL